MDCGKSQATRHAAVKKRQIVRKQTELQITKATLVRISTPPPSFGRKHEPVQTEIFLEELFEKPNKSEIAVQTSYFLDRPTSPPYCLLKSGQDASTQIEHKDLFDYDVQIQPILEVLVSKTIEQALVEVLEEEEITIIREQQRKFLELRVTEEIEHQRLQEQDRRFQEENNRRIKQYKEIIKIQQETEERLAVSVLFTECVAELLPTIIESLKISSSLLDHIKTDVQEDFMSWLMKEIKKEMGTMIQSRDLLEELIKKIIENRAKIYMQLGEEYDKSRKLKTEDFKNVSEAEVVPNIFTNNNENCYSQ